MTPDHFLAQSELDSQSAHFVFEEFLERLEQFKLHARGKPADVVMTLE